MPPSRGPEKKDEPMAVPRQPILNVPQPVGVLLVATFVLHVIRLSLPGYLDDAAIRRFGFIPAHVLSWWSGGEGTGPFDALAPFVTHIFIHADFTHLILNMIWLLPFGAVVARRLGGTATFYVFYLLTGAIGALTYFFFYPSLNSPLVGASGAISGLMGGAVRFMFTGGWGPLTPLTDSRVVLFTVVFLLVNVVFGSVSLGFGGNAIAWQAHIGGYLAGLLLLGVFDRRARRGPFA